MTAPASQGVLKRLACGMGQHVSLLTSELMAAME